MSLETLFDTVLPLAGAVLCSAPAVFILSALAGLALQPRRITGRWFASIPSIPETLGDYIYDNKYNHRYPRTAGSSEKLFPKSRKSVF